ncbi:malonate--CoA ligase [Profundibacter sp.]|uniref:malonate--CoA ligase n=1 Tax=Profundibacter sp. TaxID=3101071 RepID=UPI003D104CFF
MTKHIGHNLFGLFQSRFPKDTSDVFLEHARGELSYADLEILSGRYAAVLKSCGVNKGDRVVVQVKKSPEAVLLYLACLRAGAVYIPLNTAYTLTEVRYFVEDAKPRLIVCDPNSKEQFVKAFTDEIAITILTLAGDGTGSFINRALKLVPDHTIANNNADDVAAILYTSGTTGRSKGAMLTHGNLSSNALVLHDYWGWVPGDVLLHALPIFHVHGLFVALHCALLNASKVVFHNKFDTDQIIKALPHVTVMMGVPTFYTRLLETPDFDRHTCRNIRLFISGSAPLLAESFNAFENLTGHKILERYGMTEAGMITSNPYDGERIAGSVGFALPGVKARIADQNGNELPYGEVGVLEIAGPNVFAGYWQMPEKTAEEFRADGYFITGDMAEMDKNRRISIVGRAKDLVISGGYNVYPKEVESIIDEMPDVIESAVIGVPHPDFGEAVTAVIVTNDGAQIDTDTVQTFLGGKLARFKQPKQVFIVSELPRNTMGKVQKKVLREQYADTY